MKKIIVLFCLLAVTVTAANAQTKGFTLGSWFQAETISLNGHKNFDAIDLVIAPGYAFSPSVFARLQLDITAGMWDNGKDNRYSGIFNKNVTLGPTIGYNILKNNSHGDTVDVTATVGKTLINGKNAWSYHFYDVGVGWTITNKERTGLHLGIGVRYHDSHNRGMDNFCSIYAKWGFRFN